jgi:hypothetical protein
MCPHVLGHGFPRIWNVGLNILETALGISGSQSFQGFSLIAPGWTWAKPGLAPGWAWVKPNLAPGWALSTLLPVGLDFGTRWITWPGILG